MLRITDAADYDYLDRFFVSNSRDLDRHGLLYLQAIVGRELDASA